MEEEVMTNSAAFDPVTIVTSEKYKRYANLLDAVLEHDKQYTHEEIEKIIENTLNQKVMCEVNA